MSNDPSTPLDPPQRYFAWGGFTGLDQAQVDLLAVTLIVISLVALALCITSCTLGIEPLMPTH